MLWNCGLPSESCADQKNHPCVSLAPQLAIVAAPALSPCCLVADLARASTGGLPSVLGKTRADVSRKLARDTRALQFVPLSEKLQIRKRIAFCSIFDMHPAATAATSYRVRHRGDTHSFSCRAGLRPQRLTEAFALTSLLLLLRPLSRTFG